MKPIGNLIAGAVLALAPFAAHAQADAYPSKPVRLIVGFTPGSAPADLAAIARNDVAKWTKVIKQAGITAAN